jgi:aryl-alcohol dehydrogenase-like predicted oxidoreductase
MGVERIILATKVGFQMGDDPMARGLSRRYILQEVEATLKRLQTDAIDLYQAHGDDPATPLTETMATFDELVQQGKVRYVGASNSARRGRRSSRCWPRWMMARYAWPSRVRPDGR